MSDLIYTREELKKIIEEENIISRTSKKQSICKSKISEIITNNIILYTSKCRNNISERIFWILNDIEDYPLCIECGKQWYPRYYGLNCKSFNNMNFCSKKCCNSNIKTKLKIQSTCIERYGVTQVLLSKEMKDKIKQTNLERYGSENVFGSKQIQTKIKQTNLENLGVEYPIQNVEIKNKIKQTNLQRLGYENPAQSPEIQTKIKQTNLENLGVEYPAQSQEVQAKMQATCEERYAVKNAFQSEEKKDKIKQTNLERYGVQYPIQSEEILQIVKKTNIKKYGAENVMQNAEISEKNHKKKFKYMTLPSGKEIYYQGYEDVAIKKLLEDYSEEEIILRRKEIPAIWYENKKKRYFPDIYIPKDNLIIEVKSLWTYEKDLEKNLKKKEATLQMGYNFQFWICSNKEILQIL